MELNKSNQSIGGGDSSSDLAKSQWDETKVNDKVDVASSAIDQDKDTEVEKSADKAKASRIKKLVASVAIGLTLAISGGVHAYQQHVENQRVAEAAEEEQAANWRRQKVLDHMPKYDELYRDQYIYNEADWVLGYYDITDSYEVGVPNRVKLGSPKEFEECFHITPEDYQKQCLEKYGINADDFADDTEAEAQQRFDKAKQKKDEYEARSEARREAAEQHSFEPEKPSFTDAELQALQNGDVSYFKKSKESKVKQALNARIRELGWDKARKEATRQQQLDQTEADTNTDSEEYGKHPEVVKGEDTGYHRSDSGGEQDFVSMDDSMDRDKQPDRSSWNDDGEINRRDRAYHEREPQESEQWNRKEISDTIDLE